MESELLPPFLRHGNIARLADGGIWITDRRLLPFERKEHFCSGYAEAAAAIRDMVTQGGGPLEAALLALLDAYRKGEDLDEAARTLSAARPTNTTMKRTLEGILAKREEGIEKLVAETFCWYDRLYDEISDIGSGLIEDGDGILTRCFAEHTFLLSVAKAKRAGKRVRVYVAETRPYLQGSRLTEPSLRAMGIECYIVADAMNAALMQAGKVSKVMTASDLALPDRRVVNKTGTLSDAVCASYYGIPYYAFALSLDRSRVYHDIPIEYRSEDEMKRAGTARTAEEEARAWYPCFDVIPSSLVSGIITKEGVI